MQALRIAAGAGAFIGSLFSILCVGVTFAMWPGVLLGSVGTFALIVAMVLMGPAQIIALMKNRFATSLAMFAAQAGLLLVVNEFPIGLGPTVCTWGPYRGLIDCGLPHH